MKSSFLALLWITSGLPLLAQPFLQDDSFSDESFLRFKVQLIRALLDQDPEQLAPLLADTIPVSMDYFPAKYRFLEDLEESVGAQWGWEEMLRLVRFGFAYQSGNPPRGDLADQPGYFVAPSFWQHFPEDPDTHLLILGERVNVREQPGLSHPVIAQLSWEVVPFHHPLLEQTIVETLFVEGRQWFEVELSSGRIGYVVETYASAGLLGELVVAKRDGRWKIISYHHRPGC